TGTLGRHHGRAQRMLGRAGAPEGGAVVRLLQATENLPAYAGGRLPCLQSTHFESMLGIVLAELVAQAKPALGDAADPPPSPPATAPQRGRCAARLPRGVKAGEY